MDLLDLGWEEFFKNRFEQYKPMGLKPGRIIRESRHIYYLEGEEGKKEARISGHFRYLAVTKAEYPTVGDWVAYRDENGLAVITNVLERKTGFSRKTAGHETEEQIIAVNIDYIFIVFGLDGGRNFNARGMERYLTRAWDSGTEPVVLLNKADLCNNKEEILYEANAAALGVPVYAVSAFTGEGMDSIHNFLRKGKTAVLTGPSGVGKSALTNRLLKKETKETGAVREFDGRGRHTTSYKELLVLPGGALLIDTPGLRELQLWGTEDNLDNTFSEIAKYASKCRFKDCSHQTEPGCEVQEALSEGNIDSARFQNYLNMKRELRYLAERQDQRARVRSKEQSKAISKFLKNHDKRNMRY